MLKGLTDFVEEMYMCLIAMFWTHPVLPPPDGVQEASDHWEPGCHGLQLASDIAEDATLVPEVR